MPGMLLHAGAVVLCTHAGQAQPIAPEPRVLVSGQPVATQTGPYAIVGCALTGTSAPPCVTAQWITAATRVFAGGAPVVLMDSQAICVPTGTPLNIISTQMRVQGT